MKKLTFTIATFVCILSLFIYSCRKEKEIKPIETSKEVKGPNLSSSSNFSDTNIVVSPYGFLIFRTQAAFENYCRFATSSSHAEVQDFLHNLGFTSQGASLYGEEYSSQELDSSQFVYYILDQNNIVQIDNIIFRPIEDTAYDVKWKFLLTMTATNLSNSTYEYMADGIFNSQVMNKFATNQDLDFNLFEFVKNTPSGYQETQNNMGQALKPPFRWGPWVNTSCTLMSQDRWIDMTGDGEPDPTYNSCRRRKHYIFWIGFNDNDCFVAGGCPG